jgi:two-component system, sensor histidine kinase and response regulator
MHNRVLAAIKHPSLKLTIIGIIFVVLLPTLGVVAATLYGASRSFYDASTRQMLETARTVARSAASELELTANVLQHLAQLHAVGENLQLRRHGVASFANGDLASYVLERREGVWQSLQSLAQDPALQQLLVRAAQTGQMQVSDIRGTTDPRQPLQVTVAVPGTLSVHGLQVTTLTTHPEHLLHALSLHGDQSLSVILAITDGQGRILERSVDSARFVGKPVPDWQRLAAQPADSGTLTAQTLEGEQIIFAYQRIAGTPGWVAVVGESAASLNQRSQQPLRVLVAAAVTTVCLALALALWLARRALQPIRLLAARAQHIVVDQERSAQRLMADVPPSFVAEFEALRQSLDQADQVLQQSLKESRRAEQVAQEHLAMLQAAEEQALIGHWSLDAVTGSLNCSDMITRMSGGPRQAVVIELDDLKTRLQPESYERMRLAAQLCLQKGTSYAMEVENLRPDGSTFTAFLRGWAVRDAQGAVVGLDGTLQDISEVKEQHARLAALADNLPSGVIFRLQRDLQRKLSLQFLSAGLEALTGFSANATLQDQGRLLQAMGPADLRRILRVLVQAQQAGHVLDEEFALRCVRGERVWIHCRAALRYLGTGEGVWDGIARDVTAARAAEQALLAAKESAERAERAKSDFLATMSHEIRTPMNSVIGMARLAMRTHLDPKQRNYLEKINESANVLLGIINDILDFSKIEAGGLVLEGAPFRLESVLDSVAALTVLKAEEKGLEMTYAMVPGLPAVVRGDALRLGQVLTNLVSNAVKFTEAGDVVVRVGLCDEGQGPMLYFSVSDSGIGLSAEHVRQLFQPFVQAQTDTSRRYGGTGLGLAISKRLVEMMGGSIGVDSEEGVGSTFFFTVPLEVVPEVEAPRSARAGRRGALRGQRILIADDNAMARQALAEMADGFGMQVTVASNGQDALALLHTHAARYMPFDMVVLDWRMPVMDGLEAARQIKSDAQLEHMPAVLMVTAYGQDAMLQAAQGMSLQGVLLKPVTQSALLNTLLHATTGQPLQGVASAHSVWAPVDVSVFSALRGKRVLVADDNALNREVAADVLGQVGVQVLTAVDGLDAMRCLHAQAVDAVLMDIHMPNMDGLSATRAIRGEARWQHLPIIALTAQASSEDVRLSHEAGMNGHLTKPIDELALYRTLLAHCAGQGMAGATAPARDDVPPQEALALHAFARLPKSPARRAHLLRGFLTDFAPLPAHFARWMAQSQWSEMAAAVHQIKGSASYLDARELCAVAHQLEAAARGGQAQVVQQLAGPFLDAVQQCLHTVRQALQALEGEDEQEAVVRLGPNTKGATDGHLVMALIAQARPLVASGNFAAQEVLEQLAVSLAGSDWAALAHKALQAFDELETESTLQYLSEIDQACSASRSP